MGENPSSSLDDEFVDLNKPVINVNWGDVQEFIARLNYETENKYSFRLPSESEWEYAARSGAYYDKWSGANQESCLEHYVWYSQNSDHCVHKVGQKCPNALNLYDMSGNVREWCED